MFICGMIWSIDYNVKTMREENITQNEHEELLWKRRDLEEVTNVEREYKEQQTSYTVSYDNNISINNITNDRIPNNIEEITNNQYEVLKRLKGANIKYAFTGIINAYHSNLPKLVTQFKQLELLKYSDLEEAIQKLTIKELKRYLRNKGLKLTGNKKDLIDRLLPNLNEQEKEQILVENKCYVLTDKGKEIVKNYENLKKNNLKKTFEEVIDLFKIKKFKEGYSKICEYESKYSNLGGLNFNWTEELNKGLDKIGYNVLNWFMNKEITLDSSINIEDFKAITCFAYLSGKSYNDIITLIRDVYNYNEDILNIQYYNIMITNEREALSLEDLDMRYYKILDTDDSCTKCKNKAHKKMKLSERKVGTNFPPLCKECRCTIVAYFEEDV